MLTLGINAAFHDSAAVIIKDGKLIAAAEEERFTQIKHGKRPIPFSAYELPFHAMDYCMKEAGVNINQVDAFAYSFDPSLLNNEQLGKGDLRKAKEQVFSSEWDRLFLSYIENAPAHLRDGYPHHLEKRFAGATIDPARWHFVDHHLAHAASAFICSPFDKAAVMVLDGRGELTGTSYYKGDGQNLDKINEVFIPHSLGLLYERITTYLGFLHSSDEYKVMALASYGRPRYIDDFRRIIEMGKEGMYKINDFDPVALWGEARQRGAPVRDIHFDIASSLQKSIEETVLKLSHWLYDVSGSENLCMAGGVALNCVMNAVIRDHSPFKNIWVQPAAGDAGTALGAALWIDQQVNGSNSSRHMDHVYWGPSYSDDSVESLLKWMKIPYRRLTDVPQETAALLANDKVIGWFQGRMEFGPRALGSRSILASPRTPSMQQKLNEIKDREDFRPVAPVVMEEYAGDWFENAGVSPFMLFIYNVKGDRADEIPAATHVDGTARVQTINRDQHPEYYDLLSAFNDITGVPVLINTSFNTRGKPIVCTPEDAISCLFSTPLDGLVINSFYIEKNGS